VTNPHFEDELNAALRQAPAVDVPRNFRQRLMTRLPEKSAPDLTRRWQLPALAAAIAILIVTLVVAGLEAGLVRWLAQPSMLLTILGIETVLALAWLWRTVFSR